MNKKMKTRGYMNVKYGVQNNIISYFGASTKKI